MKVLNAKLREKFIEALKAVLPIVAIVLILGFTIAPVTPSVLLCFLVGTVMVMAGTSPLVSQTRASVLSIK